MGESANECLRMDTLLLSIFALESDMEYPSQLKKDRQEVRITTQLKFPYYSFSLAAKFNFTICYQ